MKHLIKFCTVVYIIFGTHVAHGTDTATANQEPVIRGLMQQWLTAYNSKNIEALLSLYSDEIYFANNGNSIKRGPSDIRQHFGPQFSARTKTTIDFSEELITIGEDLAHISGKYRVNIPQENGNTAQAFGRVLLIFKKEATAWKLIVDFDNSANDISSNDFK